MKSLLLRLLVFVVVLIAVAELFFRFVIPASNTAYKVLDPQFGILLHDTATSREGYYTTGRLAEGRTHWRINNYGWNSPRDYTPARPGKKPIIAVIGDSFVAGFMVEQRKNLSYVLEELVAPRYEVYNLGQNGACGSQYVYIARYAAANFDPDVFVFLSKDGDWTQSITNYWRDQRVHQYRYQDGQFIHVPPHYHPTWLSRLPKRSAIIRYLQFNGQLDIRAGLKMRKEHHELPRIPDEKTWKAQYPLAEAGLEYMITQIRQDHPGKPIVFMADGILQNIYAGKSDCSGSSLQWLREACRKNDCHVLDLGAVLAEHYARERRRFTFAADGHWNAEGHRVVAEALHRFMISEGVIPPCEMDMPSDTLLAALPSAIELP